MRKVPLSILCFLSIALAMTPVGQGPKIPSSNLAGFIPTGSILYLESPDFASLVRDWENSQEKPKWLASDNYQVFSRSKLFIRLQEAQIQFAAAAGAPPDMTLLDSLAGDQSALALYDIGNLEFLYITRMPSARALQNVLWTNRAKFEPRKSADIPYYVRAEPEKNRVVAFATSGDYLLLATREDLIATALALLSGKSRPALRDESWYKTAVSAAGPAGDLRMILNMPELVQSPHFRSYWIQRNITALRSYSTEVADIHRSANEIREDRILVKSSSPDAAGTPASANPALGEILGMVPNQGGIYRAWSAPSADSVLDLLAQKILTPRSGSSTPSQSAPEITLTQGETGSESDLETRIDVPPLGEGPGGPGAEALKKLLQVVPLQAALEFQTLQNIGPSPFIEPHTAVVIRSTANWNADATRTAIRAAVEGLLTTSQVGVNWVESHEGSADYYQLDGMVHLAVAIRGPILIVADSAETLKPFLTNSPAAEVGGNVIYAAGFRHAAERERIAKMMRMIETPLQPQDAGSPGQPGHEPLFFSENLASLSQSLDSVETESLVIEDRGSQLRQTVTYRLKQ